MTLLRYEIKEQLGRVSDVDIVFFPYKRKHSKLQETPKLQRRVNKDGCSKGAQKTPTPLIGGCTQRLTEQAWPQFLEQYSTLTLWFWRGLWKGRGCGNRTITDIIPLLHPPEDQHLTAEAGALSSLSPNKKLPAARLKAPTQGSLRPNFSLLCSSSSAVQSCFQAISHLCLAAAYLWERNPAFTWRKKKLLYSNYLFHFTSLNEHQL